MDKIKILLVLPNYALPNQIKSGRFNMHNPKEKKNIISRGKIPSYSIPSTDLGCESMLKEKI